MVFLLPACGPPDVEPAPAPPRPGVARPNDGPEARLGTSFRSRRAEEAGNRKASHPAAGRPRPEGMAAAFKSSRQRPEAAAISDPPGAEPHRLEQPSLPADVEVPEGLYPQPPQVLTLQSSVEEATAHYQSQAGARVKLDPEGENRSVLIPVKEGFLMIRIVRVQDRTIVVKHLLGASQPLSK